MEKNILTTVEEYLKKLCYGESTGHDWWHIKRVQNLALKINQEEKQDEFTIKMIALLHDVFDEKFSKGDIREKLIKLMQDLHIHIDEQKKENILHSCCNIGYKGGFKKIILSREGQIVQDADRIDATGAIGIARVFAYNGKKGNQIYNPEQGIIEVKSEEEYRKMKRHAINHFYEKLLKIKDTMNTTTGKKIADERTKFMEQYLDIFYKEWDGER